MFGLFKKKKDAKASDTSATAGKDAAPKKAAAKDSAPKAAAPVAKTKAPPAKTEKTDTLKAAIAAMEGEPAAPAEKVSAGDKLDKVKDALAKKAANPPMDRKALIEQALAIQQTQAKMLDKLPDEARQKLRALAMKTFVIDKPTDKKKMN